jgi:NIPSNAP
MAVIYELRIYETVPGRLGALNARFQNVTLRMFERHGIKPVGFWEDVIGISNRLTYLLAWENMAHRERAWDAFASDPEWLAARAKSEEDGPIVARVISTFMRPTSYSAMQ